MTEQEFFHTTKQILEEVKKLKPNTKHEFLMSFLKGILSGLGSVIGGLLAIALIGWILNIAGVIPRVKETLTTWQEILQKNVQQKIPSTQQNKNYQLND